MRKNTKVLNFFLTKVLKLNELILSSFLTQVKFTDWLISNKSNHMIISQIIIGQLKWQRIIVLRNHAFKYTSFPLPHPFCLIGFISRSLNRLVLSDLPLTALVDSSQASSPSDKKYLVASHFFTSVPLHADTFSLRREVCGFMTAAHSLRCRSHWAPQWLPHPWASKPVKERQQCIDSVSSN